MASAYALDSDMIGDDVLGVAGLTPGGVGAIGTFAMSIIALIKAWPVLAKLSIDQRAAKRLEGREEAAGYLDRIERMETRQMAAEKRTHEIELKFTVALGAYRIVASELQRISPESSALMQAQALLTAAYPVPGEMPPELTDILHTTPAR